MHTENSHTHAQYELHAAYRIRGQTEMRGNIPRYQHLSQKNMSVLYHFIVTL